MAISCAALPVETGRKKRDIERKVSEKAICKR